MKNGTRNEVLTFAFMCDTSNKDLNISAFKKVCDSIIAGTSVAGGAICYLSEALSTSDLLR
jgi:hypothetical protein